MKTNEIRDKFLEFFRQKGHTLFPSDSLIPSHDPTLLFTGAGMNQFKDYFLGKGPPDVKRAVSCQKCLRTGDLDNVGKTPSHHTFFEMLGNFSFGDYFKKEAITWAWEFLTGSEESGCLGIPSDRLRVSVYQDDEEAYTIWKDTIQIKEDWIYRFGPKDNFWPANAPAEGPNGPCGPCSEIYYDLGPDPEYACCSHCNSIEDNERRYHTCCDNKCRRFVEIWNLVFTQFDRQEDGSLKPLPQKNIDTGMGLERLASVLQGVPSNFRTDLFQPLAKKIKAHFPSLLSYEQAESSHPYQCHFYRVLSDHIRAITFCIADTVIPSNTGRGYVLRKIIRNALTELVALDFCEPFLYQLVPSVVEVMSPFKDYRYLQDRQTAIVDVLKAEEEKFLAVVEQGLDRLDQEISDLLSKGKKMLSGKIAFELYDTYGLPLLLIQKRLSSNGLSMNDQEFEHEREVQKKRSRKSSKIEAAVFTDNPLLDARSSLRKTEFLGYDNDSSLSIPMTIHTLTILDPSTKKPVSAEEVPAGNLCQFITDQTVFYGEQGGQVGDTGWVYARKVEESKSQGVEKSGSPEVQKSGSPEVGESNSLEVEITDTQRLEEFIVHHGKVLKGALHRGQQVVGQVDKARRLAIARNHTATHLLQAALRQVLGTHVEQAGSIVLPEKLRFDFTHLKALTAEEIHAVERIVNEKILDDEGVHKEEKSFDEARKEGALAFFGEKYKETVRVVTLGTFSKELCGGTHLDRTGTIGLFRMTSETAIASGTRRIEAITGPQALQETERERTLLQQLSQELNTQPEHLAKKIQDLQEQMKKLKKDLDRFQRGEATNLLDTLAQKTISLNGVQALVEECEGMDPKELRSLVDQLRDKKQIPLVLLIHKDAESSAFFLGLHPDWVSKGLDAGKLLKDLLSPLGGSGGGRSTFAQGGLKQSLPKETVLEKLKPLIRY